MGVVRLAAVRDIPALRRLCRAAIGPDDYVLQYLPEMIRGREVIVTEAAGRIVAMAGVTECADRALWIGQMRTHPAFRRRGFARAILEDVVERARRERRPALRLWAAERNVASRALFERTGFREMGRYTRVQAPAMRPPSGPQRRDFGGGNEELGVDALDELRREGRRIFVGQQYANRAYTRWLHSVVHRSGRGYIAYHWHFLPLTRTLLRAMARRGELLDRRGTILMWMEPGDPAAYATILAGGRRALEVARRAAAEQGRRRVEIFLPNDRQILRWATETGFSPAGWGRHAVLYERQVRAGRQHR